MTSGDEGWPGATWPGATARVDRDEASFFVATSREGVVTVHDDRGRYVGCMGIETWRDYLAAETKRYTTQSVTNGQASLYLRDG